MSPAELQKLIETARAPHRPQGSSSIAILPNLTPQAKYIQTTDNSPKEPTT